MTHHWSGRRGFRRLGVSHLLGVILALCAGGPALPAQTLDLQFKHLSIRDGLSQSIVDAMIQDRKGFVWFVTEDGLNRFDGYRFEVFKHDAQDPHSLVHNEIKCIAEGRDGILWVGSFSRGLERFEQATGRFTHYQHDPTVDSSLSNDIVWSVLEDREGRVWVGTGAGLDRLDRATGKFVHYRLGPEGAGPMERDDVRALLQDQGGALWVGTAAGGLCRLDPATGASLRFTHDAGDPDSLSHDDVRALARDRDGAVWVGTRGGGLDRLDPMTGVFRHFRHAPRDPRSLGADIVLALTLDDRGNLWVGTDGGGLERYDREKGDFVRYTHDPYRPGSLASDRVYSLLQDRSGILWVGTYGAGVSRCELNRKQFLHFRHDPTDPDSLAHDIVWSFCEDPSGFLWIGTNDGGLDRFDRATGRFAHHRHDPGNPRSLGHNSVRMVVRDHAGILWAATNGGGLNRFDPTTGRFTRFRHDAADPGSLAHDELRMVFEDREGNLWVGTYGGGLDRFDPSTGRFVHHRADPADPKSISGDYVRAAFQDRSGILWFGTHGAGLNRYDPATGVFVRYRNDPADPSTLSNDFVFSVHEDRSGALWVATYGGGLNRLDRATGRFTAFRKSDGLPDDAVYGILEDDDGRLWLSTNSGLARFDPRSGVAKTYTQDDGLQSNEFNGGSYYRSPRGEMFFGGINGFNAFFPAAIRDNAFRAPVVFTDFQLSNQSVPVGPMADGRVMLERSIDATTSITLTHLDRVVSFEFAALDFASPDKNRYAYRLEGLHRDWLDLGNRRFVMFTTLPAGRYRLMVKGTNGDGVWNEEGAAIRLLVRPPWWRTGWADLAYALLLLGGVVGLVRFERKREREKGQVVEAELRATAAELQTRTVEAETRALKSENERKTRELEEARRLQVSMLPKEVPRHPRYAVAARMRTATEVGGDYYDFHVGEDGTLTVAIGDATGHGTRAGIMVAIMKGLFARLCFEPDLCTVLRESNRTLEGIELDPMYMALGLLRLDGLEARAVAAAMPPIFVFRASLGEVEQISIPGMLLGTHFEVPWEEIRFALAPGDKVFLLSDGYLEQADASETMLDYDRCRDYFLEVAAEGTPESVIDHLLARFDAWRGAVAQGDDVTMVVIEVRR